MHSLELQNIGIDHTWMCSDLKTLSVSRYRLGTPYNQ